MGRRKPEIRRKKRRHPAKRDSEVSVLINGKFMHGEQELKEGDNITLGFDPAKIGPPT